jgi:hypothetical protein
MKGSLIPLQMPPPPGRPLRLGPPPPPPRAKREAPVPLLQVPRMAPPIPRTPSVPHEAGSPLPSLESLLLGPELNSFGPGALGTVEVPHPLLAPRGSQALGTWTPHLASPLPSQPGPWRGLQFKPSRGIFTLFKKDKNDFFGGKWACVCLGRWATKMTPMP